MEREGLAMADALAAAKAHGYAEADPTLDTEAHDPAQKLVVLARLAFGSWIRPADVRRTADEAPGAGGAGIANVSAEDIREASRRGERVRLVAQATLASDGDIDASVLPRFVAPDDPLSSARGVTNVIQIDGPPLGRLVISGPGAGGPATAAAVVADLVRLSRGAGSTWAGLPPATNASMATDAPTTGTPATAR
jgi:homoserine dehydrogenase